MPEPTAEAVRFHRTGLPLWFVGRAWSLGVPALILLSGLSARLRAWAMGRSRPRPWYLGVVLYALAYLAIDFALRLPLRYFAGFVRLHDYGLSVQPLGRWFGDELKGLAIWATVATLLLWVPYRLMARSPRRWWLWTGSLILPASAFSALIAPTAIDPMFNTFGPMRDKALEARIDALARRAGIDGGKIFEVDKSRDTTALNAYVTGLLGTKRIVLWDTLLEKLDDREVLVVMGHEMGHYVLDHVAIGLVLSSLGTILALFLIDRAARWLIRRHARRFGFDRIGDIASAPLLVLLAQLTTLAGAPAIHAAGRWMEGEADRFAIEITRDNHAGATGEAKLMRGNLAIPHPDPFSYWMRSTHPSIRERIEFCNRYRPWADGRPLRYGHLFRDP